MILPEPYTVEICEWSLQHPVLAKIRRAVFVEEQKLPAGIERDEADAAAVQVIARDASGQVIGTGRLLLESPLARIGRMAVLKTWRRAGVGSAMLDLLCREAKRRGFAEVTLSAHVHAVPFYFKHGFLSHGREFTEAGIPHQTMHKTV